MTGKCLDAAEFGLVLLSVTADLLSILASLCILWSLAGS
jgi:hypothetical protein